MTIQSHGVSDDSHSDYHDIKSRAAAAMRRGVWSDRFEPRYEPFSRREMRSDLSREAIAAISEGKHYASYRGIPLAKDPFDLQLYEMLFYEVRPRTVIELGAYTGASAWWMADILQCFGIQSQVISVDIDLSLLDENVWNDPAVTFLEGDCNQIDSIFPAERLAALPHPLVLIDDAHVNLLEVYEHFHQHAFEPGDYLIVEDTNPWIPGNFGEQDSDAEWGDWKWQELQGFFAKHEHQYQVDRYYTDFFGYNGTWNWNGFVRRM
jgi:cephalosporin hydroxylase